MQTAFQQRRSGDSSVYIAVMIRRKNHRAVFKPFEIFLPFHLKAKKCLKHAKRNPTNNSLNKRRNCVFLSFFALLFLYLYHNFMGVAKKMFCLTMNYELLALG